MCIQCIGKLNGLFSCGMGSLLHVTDPSEYRLVLLSCVIDPSSQMEVTLTRGVSTSVIGTNTSVNRNNNSSHHVQSIFMYVLEYFILNQIPHYVEWPLLQVQWVLWNVEWLIIHT